MLAAAREREQASDHFLFAGPPGLGKTTSGSSQQYPFKIELSGSGNSKFTTQGSENLIASITSSVISTSDWSHVICQKLYSVEIKSNSGHIRESM